MPRVFEDMTDKFAHLLRTARTAAGLTQAELAAAAGISKHTIAKYEGAERLPSYETADDIACALNLNGEDRDALMAAAHPPRQVRTIDERLTRLEEEVMTLDELRAEVARLVQANLALAKRLDSLAPRRRATGR